MQTILDVVLPIFGLIALGYLAARLGLLTQATGDALARFVFVVAVPVLLFRTLAEADFGGADPFALWIAYFGSMAIVSTTGALLLRTLLGADRRKSVIGGIAAGYGNTVLVSIPVLQQAYGERGLEPLLLIISIHLPLMMLVSTLVMEQAAHRDAGDLRSGEGAARPPTPLTATLRRVARNLATNAIVVGILAGLLWRTTGLPMEPHVDEVVGLLGGTAGPLALFCLGMSLTRYGLRGDLAAAAIATVLSLVAMPALVYLAATSLALPPLWLKAAVITAASPAGVNAYLFAMYFKAGEKLAATSILTSTVASVLTLSAWLLVLG